MNAADASATAPGPRRAEELHDLVADPLSDLQKHHRRRRPRDAPTRRRGRPARDPRDPDAVHRHSTGRSRGSGTSATPTSRIGGAIGSIDFQASNLHVVGYSTPVDARMTLAELRQHLFTIPERPDWIPYRTSYYRDTWGFCLSHNALLGLEDGTYEVCIDSTLEDGHLTYGELHLPGERADEVLISTHVCHPSLANDNLSGIAVAAFLARTLAELPRRLSYRFLFVPARSARSPG